MVKSTIKDEEKDELNEEKVSDLETEMVQESTFDLNTFKSNEINQT